MRGSARALGRGLVGPPLAAQSAEQKRVHQVPCDCVHCKIINEKLP